MKLNSVDSTSIYCATVGIFFYVLFKFFTISVFQVVSALFMVVALLLLFVAAWIAWRENLAYKRYESFEKLKKELTDQYNEQSDSTAENEKSENDADPQ